MYRENYVGINGINRLNANYAAAFLKLAKHYKLADEIREKFQAHHIVLEDLPSGKTVWKVEVFS